MSDSDYFPGNTPRIITKIDLFAPFMVIDDICYEKWGTNIWELSPAGKAYFEDIFGDLSGEYRIYCEKVGKRWMIYRDYTHPKITRVVSGVLSEYIRSNIGKLENLIAEEAWRYSNAA